MAVTELTVAELRETKQFVQTMSSALLHAEKRNIPLRISALLRRQQDLRGAQSVLLQKINMYSDLSERDKWAGDRFIRLEPGQAYQNRNLGFPDPDPRNSLAVDRIKGYNEAIQYIDNEVCKIQDEMKRISQDILLLTRKLEWIDERIENDKLKMSDMEARQILDMQIDSLMKIYMVWKEYIELSTNEDSKQAYSDDPKTLKKLSQVQELLIGSIVKNPFYTSGEIKIDLNDIRSEATGKALSDQCQKLRILNRAFIKNPSPVEAAANTIDSNINNPFISRNLTRKEESSRLPSPEESLSKKTSTLGGALELYNSWMNLSHKDYFGAFSQFVKRSVGFYHNGMVLCDSPPASSSEEKRIEQQKEIEEQRNIGIDDIKSLKKRLFPQA